MNLEDRIKLIDDLIKEDPDSTIADYIMLVGDIDSIQKTVKERDMAKQIDHQQRQHIVELFKTKTPAEIHHETKYAFSTIYKALELAGIDYKAVTKKRKEAERIAMRERQELHREREIEARKPKKPIVPDPPLQRPPAIYSNHSPYGIAS